MYNNIYYIVLTILYCTFVYTHLGRRVQVVPHNLCVTKYIYIYIYNRHYIEVDCDSISQKHNNVFFQKIIFFIYFRIKLPVVV